MCPVCGEEYAYYTFLEDAVLSLRNEENSLENISLFPSELRQEHWSSPLKFAKNSQRFQ